MAERENSLTLDRLAHYQIKVPGVINPQHCDWLGDLESSMEGEEAGNPITVLIGDLDQAALHGLLRRLYAQGLPIISVEWMGVED